MANKYSSKLHNKRVLVVGGTSGIGFCVAEASIESGAAVIVASSQQSRVDQTIERIKVAYPEQKGNITGHPCDLASPEVESNIKVLLELATNGGKDKLDHIVFTAGDRFGLVGLEDVTIEIIQKFGTVRFTGAILLAKHASQYMHSAPTSSLTLTGGVNSTKPGPGWALLAGWGAAIEGLTRGLSVDLKPIRVNCVAPGAVLTELFDIFETKKQGIVDYYTSRTLTNTIGKPEDLAECYLYLMKDAFVTGSRLESNGGCLLV